MVGSYNPKMNRVELNAERIKHWMSQGATVSDTVHNLLVSQKIIDAKKINILPAFKAAPVAEVAPAPAAAPVVEEAPAPAVEAAPEDNSVAQDAPQA